MNEHRDIRKEKKEHRFFVPYKISVHIKVSDKSKIVFWHERIPWLCQEYARPKI